MTDCAQDPKIRQVRAEFGNDGYAAYWLIVETISASFTRQNPISEITFAAKTWAKICEISPKKLQKFLEFSQKINLLSYKVHQELISIKVPNLLKYGDEYTGKKNALSGQNPESVGTLSGQNPDPVRASSSPSTSSSPSPGYKQSFLCNNYLENGAEKINVETGEIVHSEEGDLQW